ncbi:hypothetical protein ACIPY2_08865 [Paenarthrobacter sp. NPDC089675]|uniref:hypothetical protein n=1 Tax=Paenarthrobacter sp. NPDC089675 TaxID=3364376 RepID=UPI0038135DF1
MGVGDGLDEVDAFELFTELAVDVPPQAVVKTTSEPIATKPNALPPTALEDLPRKCLFLDVRKSRNFKVMPPFECADAMALVRP